MSKPVTWNELKKWKGSEAPDEDELRDAMQDTVERRRPVDEFLAVFSEYLQFLRWKETVEIMHNPTKRHELTYTDALSRLQSDVDKLIEGKLIAHGRTTSGRTRS